MIAAIVFLVVMPISAYFLGCWVAENKQLWKCRMLERYFMEEIQLVADNHRSIGYASALSDLKQAEWQELISSGRRAYRPVSESLH